MFCAPQWHVATQTHFPPRPRKSQWHCNITNVIWPHMSAHIPQASRTISKSHVSVSYETSKSRVKSPKRAFLLQKSSGNTHQSTHITQPCQAVSRFQPLQTIPAHTPIPMSQRHSPLPQLTTSRFPAPATNLSASTRLTRAKYLDGLWSC